MSHVFHRTDDPIIAVRAEGCWIYDASGRAYLDAAGGAIVSNIGHGAVEVRDAMAGSMPVDYVHPTVFTSEAIEGYADELADIVPVDRLRVFPVSGGAESVETAIKLTRAYHVARGDLDREVIVSRRHSYHGNTIGALDISGRPPLRKPYESWLGRSVQVPEVNEYRCPSPQHPEDCPQWHASQLEETINAVGPARVAAFIGEAVGGASLGAAVPPVGYWEAVADVCDRYGVLLIVDEIMTGFGRTGRWFGIEHSSVRPDIIVAGKGAAGGYWPLGLCMASGEIHGAVAGAGGFVHGFTFSHSSRGAIVGMVVLQKLRDDDLVAAADRQGKKLFSALQQRIGDLPVVGDIRGQGLLIGVEFVKVRSTKEPFSRDRRFVERLAQAALTDGLLVYPSSGCADGTTGDSILLGPPFTISDGEIETIVDRLGRAIEEVMK
jgi:adenosylmethionine-8-amino-7-oxononanoate aminotransferase